MVHWVGYFCESCVGVGQGCWYSGGRQWVCSVVIVLMLQSADKMLVHDYSVSIILSPDISGTM